MPEYFRRRPKFAAPRIILFPCASPRACLYRGVAPQAPASFRCVKIDAIDRCGAPPKFTPEQITAIIALACEHPSQSGVPVSHWTPPELAREAIKRGIVESISPRQVDRFLAKRTCDRTRASIG